MYGLGADGIDTTLPFAVEASVAEGERRALSRRQVTAILQLEQRDVIVASCDCSFGTRDPPSARPKGVPPEEQRRKQGHGRKGWC